jgi:hypothetical protein
MRIVLLQDLSYFPEFSEILLGVVWPSGLDEPYEQAKDLQSRIKMIVNRYPAVQQKLIDNPLYDYFCTLFCFGFAMPNLD